MPAFFCTQAAGSRAAAQKAPFLYRCYAGLACAAIPRVGGKYLCRHLGHQRLPGRGTGNGAARADAPGPVPSGFRECRPQRALSTPPAYYGHRKPPVCRRSLHCRGRPAQPHAGRTPPKTAGTHAPAAGVQPTPKNCSARRSSRPFCQSTPFCSNTLNAISQLAILEGCDQTARGHILPVCPFPPLSQEK